MHPTILPMDTTLSAPIGQLLDGRYLVESQIARGGMATVYQARDVRLDRVVAIKIAHPELARDQEFVARFISEARSVARLSSPNVVAVFDQGSTGDLHYIAMEYVPGPTLRELLNARGRLAPREALDIIERVLAGLAAAHDAGIIHRDVKPENVLLGNGTTVRVADFGLARAASGVSHTRTGLLIGTAAYLAPEQVASNSSDERTDVYASGVMLFEMLTGSQPHTGETPLAVAYKHVNAVVPPPSSLQPDLPPALDALVALGTSRDPELRPPDARHYLKAITEVRRGLPLPKTPRRDPRPADAASGALVDGGGSDGGAGDRGATAGRATAGGATAGGAGNGSVTNGSVTNGHPGNGSAGNGHPGNGGSAHGDGWSRQQAAGDWAAAGGLAAVGFGARDTDDAGTGPLPAFGESDGYGGYSGRGSAQHTMVVPAGGDYGYGGGYDGGGYNGRGGAGRGRRNSEPLLQRWLFSRRILIILAVVILAGVGWWTFDGQYTSVPTVAGMSLSLARGDLQNAQLKPVTGTSKHSDSVARGDVITSNPTPGTRIRHGGTVTLIVSLGPVLVQVPSVSGEQLDAAVAALKSAGLTVAQPVKYQTSTTIPAGIVISTTPAAYQSWPKNKPVALMVSSGQPLPNFAGEMVATAQATAGQGGYSINPVQLAKGSQPANTIVRQSPAPGSRITPGMVVTVYFSPGPPMVNVPNVVGEPESQAVQDLRAAGFQVSENKGLGGRVTAESPMGQAPQGSTITINIGFTF